MLEFISTLDEKATIRLHGATDKFVTALYDLLKKAEGLENLTVKMWSGKALTDYKVLEITIKNTTVQIFT